VFAGMKPLILATRLTTMYAISTCVSGCVLNASPIDADYCSPSNCSGCCADDNVTCITAPTEEQCYTPGRAQGQVCANCTALRSDGGQVASCMALVAQLKSDESSNQPECGWAQ
jgi:hypothetical protein